MNTVLTQFFTDFTPNTAVDIPTAEIEKTIVDIFKSPPLDYLQFMAATNGGEGSVGENYLVIWPSEEIKDLNVDYSVEEFAPGYQIFGSDGGDTAYAFDKACDIVEFPFIGMTMDYEPTKIASSLEELLLHLKSK
ncbi:SMI1/KNR4 family protein [Hymenobacter latericus]|uniref:SMI1/KNR4 family protein n=1 Tax=Hymenobacter sp. YIM 151858-1 TaxID=2987688 RepID=UPI0022266EE4|nr:SMI1/KNR4 family protein [Hymenobacter sp. YIM 151858-1]UYZ61205.1 SMI1/KNR4 family protein [Hymenobacter sp. YIM 151858-1]